MRALATWIALVPTIAIAQSPNDSPATQQSELKAPVLARAELDRLLATPNEVLLLDVRRPDEIASIGGFPVYLNIQPNDLEASLARIPRERTIVTVSNHAARAGRAADVLIAHGFKVAGAVGAQDYEAAGGTLVKPAAPQARR